ncbi:OmpA family protein [Pseudomonas aeruginosa]|uniref:OmpA/MotB family protein n=1 Tax=Pseudomonas aeruginosa TaxID=287 RepID=UPI00053D6148|nr:OmpA family protein [Pseudomonas aeruginosa]EJB8391758.1 OmpA family protein [Pseudomonas aeruginosa]ELK4746008.1 OmpA family protein [Pseudomonas aeruginosa]MBM2538653.1 OmpA family protein [Pseudomonas aeruginosa]MCJ1947845.1 OmpA family protein [Pseudomonas aeruginosa]MCM8585052.1 OmpA family protein [Pseudomonas aeruginosa]
MRWRKSHDVPMEDEDPYWKSFVDIMSALLVLFILASVVLILQLMEKSADFDQQVEQLKKAETVRQQILDEAVEKLRQRGIKVEVSENHTVLRIPNELLGFDTGAFEIQPRYQPTALEIGEVINQVISRDDRVNYLDTIFIEGHTDNRPFPGFMGKGNWGLSTFRAISLWQFWSTEMPEAERLNRLSNQDGEPLFSVSGYAETRPVSKQQDGEDDYRLNRRIDIRFTIRRPQSSDYEAVKTLLGNSSK